MWASVTAMGMALGDGFAVASRHGSCSRGPAQQSTNSRLARFARSEGQLACIARSPSRWLRTARRTDLPSTLSPPNRVPLSRTAFPISPGAARRAEAQLAQMCMRNYVITPDPVSARSLSRPRRSGVPDVFRKTIFLAKHCRSPDSQIETPGAAPSHSQNLPSSSEGKTEGIKLIRLQGGRDLRTAREM